MMGRMTIRPSPDEEAHDVLAAEAFAVPAPDPALHQLDVSRLPTDPTGILEAHDVLAADEFAIPAPSGRTGLRSAGPPPGSRLAAAAAAMVGILGAALIRARRSRWR